MLYQAADAIRPSRMQGYYISEDEIATQVKALKHEEEVMLASVSIDWITGTDNDSFFSSFDEMSDDLYEEVKQAVIEAGKASTSYLQRRFRIGYSRAARLIDLLEEGGVIGPQEGAKPRKVFKP